MKCFNCNKKIKGIEFECKCANTFCAKCRHPEGHKCTFDFRKQQKHKLERELIKVEPEKIIKIN